MDDDQRDQISQSLYHGLYALLGDPAVTREEAMGSLSTAIHVVNDEWGIETGQRPDPELKDPVAAPEYERQARYPKQFHDMKTGWRAAIDETELVVLAGHGMNPEDPPRRFRLADIESVKLAAMPGELVTICVKMPGILMDPCPKFGSLSYALDFAGDLRAAAGIPTAR